MTTRGSSQRPQSPPTMDDVARLAGVSRALVSMVHNDSPKVSDGSRTKVLAATRELGYRPNAQASGLASRHSRMIGVLLNDLRNPFFADMAEALEQEAIARDYHLVLNSGLRRTGEERRALDALLRLRVDGVILVGPEIRSSEIVAAASRVPTAVLTRRVLGGRVDSIVNDDRLGAEMVVDHLADLGHRRIAHIDAGRAAGATSRRSGYRRAMRRRGLEDQIRIVEGEFNDAAGIKGAATLLADRNPPTAIFAANDLCAAGVLACLAEKGLRVPDDIAVAGYDDVFLAELSNVSLTTVRQPRRAMAAAAIQSILDRLADPDRERQAVIRAPRLIVRRSTDRALGHRKG